MSSGHLIILILLLASGASSAVESTHADFYVATDGNDAWSGTLPAPNAGKSDGPFATPGRARDALRTLLAADRTHAARVLLRAGTYYLPRGLSFGPEDGGTEQASVTYAAYANEIPHLIGGVVVPGWKTANGRILRAAVPDDLPAPHQLFEEGKRMTLARFPRTGYLHLETPVKGKEKNSFTWQAGDLPDTASWELSAARLFIWPGSNWFSVEKPITLIDPATRTITLGNDEGYAMTHGNRFLIRNVPALISEPGDYAIDPQQKALYRWPATAGATCVASTASPLLAISGQADKGRWVVNLHFEGLDLSISDGDVVAITGARDCSLRGCLIENGRERGVHVHDAAERITVADCEIRENGWHGVALNGKGPGGGDVSKGHRVIDNHIHHCGRLVGHSYGVDITQSGGNQVLHNHIHHLPRYATCINGLRYQSLRESVKGVTWENHWDFLYGRNNLIAYNDIHHVDQDSQDTGALESWGPGRDNTYDHNRIHEVGNDEFDLQSAFYLDDATDYFTLTNNIVYDVRGAGGDQPVFVKGIGNRIANNIFIVHPSNESAIRSLFMADERADHHVYEHNLIYFAPMPPGGLPNRHASWGQGVGNLHPPGTRLEWKVNVPVAGAWRVHFRYAAANPFALDGRTTLAVDDGPTATLNGLPATGGWGEQAWSAGAAATLTMTAGEHRLIWTNVQGGGINLDGMALTTDAAWKPPATPDDQHLRPSATLIIVQAETHLLPPGTAISRVAYDFNNWSDDRVEASDHNLFFAPGPGESITIRGGPADKSWDKWRTLFGGKFDAHSLSGVDPLFVDAAKHDYRLKPDSPALALGFKDIDASAIGLTADFPKRLARE